MAISGSYNYPGIWGGPQPKQGPILSINRSFKQDLGNYGLLFTALTESFSISSTTVLNTLIKTPPATNGYIHFTYNTAADSKIRIAFYEAPTVTASGSEFTASNSNRASSVLSIPNFNLYGSSSISNSGTLLASAHIGLSGTTFGNGGTVGSINGARSEYYGYRRVDISFVFILFSSSIARCWSESP